MSYHVCRMVHIKYFLLQIEKCSPCGGSGFPLSLNGPLAYNYIKCIQCVVKYNIWFTSLLFILDVFTNFYFSVSTTP